MLKVENLSKYFIAHILGGKRISGFDGISFFVEAGKSLGLSGPSGIGKSSVLKCIYRTYLPTGGNVYYTTPDGNVVNLREISEHEILALRHKQIGYVTQFLKVLPRVTATEIVAYPLLRYGVPHKEAIERARSLLSRLRIPTNLQDAYPVTFSGGEKQRINLARGIIARPRLILLDEPTASLDNESMEIVADLLLEMKTAGTTMVAIFHDNRIMGELMDDIYEMPSQD
ncbi:MAG: phosphonate C-P lyase system protein PhnL [Verrucomicrobiota bacterium]